MKTAFLRCHPAVNLVYFLAVAVLGLLFLHPAFLAVSLTAALSYCLLLEGRRGVGRIAALLPLQAAVMLLNTGFAHYGVTPLYTLPGGNRITLEAIVFGAVMGVVVITMLLWFRCFSLVVTEDRFFCVLGKGFPYLSLLLLLILRFLPLLQQRLRAASEANRALGAQQKPSRLRVAAAALSGTVSYTLEHAVDTADVMRARGFGLRGRRSYARFRFRTPDALLLGAILLGFAAVLCARLCGVADAGYNPVIAIAPLTPAGLLALTAYALLCFLPQLCGLTALLRWQSGGAV
ncbi:MAG: hypothetical protein IJK64_07735 [Clostridia bacterium]|nr:hypothetical protein [Clostridia bacterium]